jgi:formiminotetrahydrofolate cyclodeaminase
MDLKKFLEKLSSDSPTPGGGSASALAGALSASLILMTAGLSSKKGGLKEREIGEIREEVLAIRKRLFRAIEEDAKSYETVMRAFRLSKSTEKQRLVRTKLIQKAYQKATVTPQLVSQKSMRLLEYSLVLIQKGNPNAVSDAGVAAFLADTAIKGGLINIRINLSLIRDESFRKKRGLLVGTLEKRRNRLMVTVEKELRRTLAT